MDSRTCFDGLHLDNPSHLDQPFVQGSKLYCLSHMLRMDTRIAKNMTIHDLAKKVNMDSIHLMRIENERHEPSLPTLRKISGVLDVLVNSLGSFDLLPETTIAERIKKARLTLGLNTYRASEI